MATDPVSKRDELAALIADAILAAGWRPPPMTAVERHDAVCPQGIDCERRPRG